MKIAGAPLLGVAGTGKGAVLIDMGTQLYKGDISNSVFII